MYFCRNHFLSKLPSIHFGVNKGEAITVPRQHPHWHRGVMPERSSVNIREDLKYFLRQKQYGMSQRLGMPLISGVGTHNIREGGF